LLPYSAFGRADSHSAGFTCPLWSVNRVWLPSRRITPGPTSPAVFQTGCTPGLGPSEVAHPGGGTAFLQLRADLMVLNPSACACEQVSTAGSAISRLWPARVPVAGRRVLPRNPARASPGLFLSEACSPTGLAHPSTGFRPRACAGSGHPNHGAAPRRIVTGRPSPFVSSAGRNRRTACLTAGLKMGRPL